MSFTHKPGHGSLFRNDKKQKDSQPDYRGDLTLEDGSTLQIAGWLKEGRSGKYLSLKAQSPLPSTDRPQERPAPSRVELDDEIPF